VTFWPHVPLAAQSIVQVFIVPLPLHDVHADGQLLLPPPSMLDLASIGCCEASIDVPWSTQKPSLHSRPELQSAEVVHA